MDLYAKTPAGDTGMMIGRVREDFSNYCAKCCLCMCACTWYFDVERPAPSSPSLFEKRFKLRANLSCCGRTNNCCGATCCKNDMVFDILDASGNLAGRLQKTYAPGGSACCRMCFHFDNYILEFPASSTPEDRLLLITSVFHLDYFAFERKGGDNNS